MRRFKLLALLVVAIAVMHRAAHADESAGCKLLAAELAKSLPESAAELDAQNQRISQLRTGCTEGDVVQRVNLHLAQIEIKKASLLGATYATDASAVGAPVKRQSGAGKVPATQNSTAGSSAQSSTTKKKSRTEVAPAAGENATPARPKPRATKASRQAGIALAAAKQVWEEARKLLLDERDASKRRERLAYYVAAATTYLEALVLFGEPSTADYGEVLAPLVSDDEAQSTLSLWINRSRLEKLLNDKESAIALREYVETTVRLGRSVSPERAAALKSAVDDKFSKAGLEQLITAWGQQQAQALAYELEQLASIGEQLAQRPGQDAEKPRLVFVVASTAAQTQTNCVAENELLTRFGERLRVIYGPKLTVQQLSSVSGETVADFSQRVKAQLAKSSCAQCDGAVGVLTTPEGNNLRVDVAFVSPRASGNEVSLQRTRVVACGETGSGELAAGAMFKELLEDRALLHDEHAPLFTAPPPIRLDPGTMPKVQFACGSAKLLPPKDPNRRGVALKGECNSATTRELSDVLHRHGYIPIIDDPKDGDLVMTLEASDDRCTAAVSVGDRDYVNFWAATRVAESPQPVDVNRAEIHNAAAGDRLAMCLSGYYFKVRAFEVPREGPEGPSETGDEKDSPRWLQALLAPGLPLLKDDDPNNDWGGYTWLIADAATVAGTIGFAFAAVGARNYAADHPSQSLETANTLLSLSFISGAMVIVSRGVSAAVLGREPKPATDVGLVDPALVRF